MIKSKHILIFIFFIFCFINSKANYKSNIYDAFINNNLNKWKKEIDDMDIIKIKSNEYLIELINYQYGFIGGCLENNNLDLAEKYLSKAEKYLEILEKEEYKLSLVYSYKSAFYAFRIGLNKFMAPVLGQKSVEFAKLAIKVDDKNPFAYIQLGNNMFYTPSIFGGSKTLALENFNKAEKLMELNGNQIKDDWNYLNLLTLIGQTYTELGNYKSAKVYYEKILKIEPRFLLVKNKLYPELLKKIK